MLSLFTLLSCLVLAVSGHVVRYDLNVSYGFWSPDCVQRQIFLINGQYPGPTLSATEGDKLVVTLRNGLSMEGLSIHWHGIRQWYNNYNDGTSGVTQCPISPGDYSTYSMTLDKAGTYMYHGHLDEQVTAGLYGKLIVKERRHKPIPYAYQGELAVILNDWYHRSIYEQVAGLESIPFVFVGEPQSLLLNGRGRYNCSLIPSGPTPVNPVVGDVKLCNASSPLCEREVFTVEYGKTYRFRISSIASLSSLNLHVEAHKLTVIAADGYLVKPFQVGEEGLDVYTGQTVDVLLRADQPVGNYWVRTGVVGRQPATPFGLAILRYMGAEVLDPQGAVPPIRPWNATSVAVGQMEKYRGLLEGPEGGDSPEVPSMPLFVPEFGRSPRGSHTRHILVNAQQMVEGHIRWAVNNVSLAFPTIPYAIGIAKHRQEEYVPKPQQVPFAPYNYSAPAPSDANYGAGYYWFKLGAVVDLVLQNTNNLKPGTSEYHPWHMHGHQFWVLGYGLGTFRERYHSRQLNFVDPPFRNTVVLPPFGWVAIRFKADNPGAWLFHCHIGAHLHMGMAIVFVHGHVLPLPKHTQLCGHIF